MLEGPPLIRGGFPLLRWEGGGGSFPLSPTAKDTLVTGMVGIGDPPPPRRPLSPFSPKRIIPFFWDGVPEVLLLLIPHKGVKKEKLFEKCGGASLPVLVTTSY